MPDSITGASPISSPAHHEPETSTVAPASGDVERNAEIVYEAMRWAIMRAPYHDETPPKWTVGGNSLVQDRAREAARMLTTPATVPPQQGGVRIPLDGLLRVRKAMERAAHDMRGWGEYVPEQFKEKWGLESDIRSATDAVELIDSLVAISATATVPDAARSPLPGDDVLGMTCCDSGRIGDGHACYQEAVLKQRRDAAPSPASREVGNEVERA